MEFDLVHLGNGMLFWGVRTSMAVGSTRKKTDSRTCRFHLCASRPRDRHRGRCMREDADALPKTLVEAAGTER
jgi:hypothetical protein